MKFLTSNFVAKNFTPQKKKFYEFSNSQNKNVYQMLNFYFKSNCPQMKKKYFSIKNQALSMETKAGSFSFLKSLQEFKEKEIFLGRGRFKKFSNNILLLTSFSFPKNKVITLNYPLDSFSRSNQDTCLVHKPAVFEGQWVQSGDLLADCSASVGGELSLGQNILIGYMPWEGYNFEDAILISEKLVYDDLYTSIHIEKYEMEIRDTKLGIEQITREIPELDLKYLENLDNTGIIKIGSWVEEGDILIGKVTPISKKDQSPYQKLLYTILEKEFLSVCDSSFRAPKGIKAKVIDIQIFKNENASSQENFKKIDNLKKIKKNINTKTNAPSRDLLLAQFSKKSNQSARVKKLGGTRNAGIGKKTLINNLKSSVIEKRGFFFSSQGLKLDNKKDFLMNPLNKFLFKNSFIQSINKIKPIKDHFLTSEILLKKKQKKLAKIYFIKKSLISSLKRKLILKPNALKVNSNSAKTSIKSTFPQLISFQSTRKVNDQRKIFLKKVEKIIYLNRSSLKNSFCYRSLYFKKKLINNNLTKEQPMRNVKSVRILLAEKRKVQIGDKMAGRHGNKGIISNILPREDMPYLPDGTPLDMVLNPLGVPSRMNVGQIYECLLGFAGKYLGENFKVFPFDETYGPEASRSFVYSKLYEARVKTGFDWLYDPYNPGKVRLYDGRTGDCFDQAITVGESYILRLVHMVDDKIHARSTGPYSLVTQQPLRGRSKKGGQRLGEMEVWALEGYGAAFTLLEMLTIKSDDMTGRMTLWSNVILNKDISIGTPESFKVLVCELQALCLDIELFRLNPKKKKADSWLKIDNLMNLS